MSASACIRGRFMPRSTIALCDIHFPPTPSFQRLLLKRSSLSCLSVAIIPCIRSSSVPMDPCTWTLLPRPILAKRRTGNPRYPATIRASNLRLVAASGVLTPTKRTRCFHPLSATQRGYVTRRVWPSTPRVDCLLRNTGETNSVRIGRSSTNPKKKLRCRLKSCCF